MLTKENLEQVKKFLVENGVRDTMLDETNVLKNDDEMVIILDGKNKRISLSTALKELDELILVVGELCYDALLSANTGLLILKAVETTVPSIYRIVDDSNSKRTTVGMYVITYDPWLSNSLTELAFLPITVKKGNLQFSKDGDPSIIRRTSDYNEALKGNFGSWEVMLAATSIGDLKEAIKTLNTSLDSIKNTVSSLNRRVRDLENVELPEVLDQIGSITLLISDQSNTYVGLDPVADSYEGTILLVLLNQTPIGQLFVYGEPFTLTHQLFVTPLKLVNNKFTNKNIGGTLHFYHRVTSILGENQYTWMPWEEILNSWSMRDMLDLGEKHQLFTLAHKEISLIGLGDSISLGYQLRNGGVTVGWAKGNSDDPENTIVKLTFEDAALPYIKLDMSGKLSVFDDDGDSAGYGTYIEYSTGISNPTSITLVTIYKSDSDYGNNVEVTISNDEGSEYREQLPNPDTLLPYINNVEVANQGPQTALINAYISIFKIGPKLKNLI